jgi:hypothetical protein
MSLTLQMLLVFGGDFRMMAVQGGTKKQFKMLQRFTTQSHLDLNP